MSEERSWDTLPQGDIRKRTADEIASMIMSERADKIDDLAHALEAITARYVELAGSGDCGFWNADEEPVVKQARAALARSRQP